MAGETDGSANIRSPRYPSISLAEAVTKTKAIYDADKTAGSPIDAALKRMGYKTRSGPATASLAALKRFGLVESRGGRLVPTPRAVSILILPEADKRRKEALREAVMAPDAYRELIEQYRQTGLPSIESLEHELALNGRFNHNAISGFVADFVASLRYAGLTNDSGAILDSAPEEIEQAPILPLPPSTAPVQVGSIVRWLSGGKDHFEAPRRVTGISTDGKWGFVDGCQEGIPMVDLHVDRDNTTPVASPPPNPFYRPSVADGPRIEFPLPDGNSVEIRLKKPVSKRDFDRIVKLIELSEDSVVEQNAID